MADARARGAGMQEAHRSARHLQFVPLLSAFPLARMAKVFLDIDIGDADAHASEVAGCACAACRPVPLRGVPRACDSRTVVPAQRGSVRASSWPAAAPTTACRVRMSAHPLPSSARVPFSPACVSLSLSAHSFCLSLALFSVPTHGHVTTRTRACRCNPLRPRRCWQRTAARGLWQRPRSGGGPTAC